MKMHSWADTCHSDAAETRKDYAVWHQCIEKPRMTAGCPGPALLVTTIGCCSVIAATAANADLCCTASFGCKKAQQIIQYLPGPHHQYHPPRHLGCPDACMCCPCALLASLVQASTVSVLLASVAHACQVSAQLDPHLQSAQYFMTCEIADQNRSLNCVAVIQKCPHAIGHMSKWSTDSSLE